MERLPIFLRERGFRVFVAPEAATLLWVHGAFHSDLDNPKCAFAFQQFVIRTQIQLEDSFVNYAECTGSDCVILCDRGTMDGSAYVSREDWLKVVKVLYAVFPLFYFVRKSELMKLLYVISDMMLFIT